METQSPCLRLNVVGAGRVGLALACLWQGCPQAPLQVQALCNRGEARRVLARAHLGPTVPLVDSLQALPEADVWLLAVPDTRIAEVAQALAELARERGWGAARLGATPTTSGTPAPQVWHASGFQTSALLAPLQALGWAAASVHPALSFAQLDQACRDFAGTVCAVEGDAPAAALAWRAFEALGGRCFTLAAADKPLYHGAAVWASNFLPVLAAVAQQLWAGSGVPPEFAQVLGERFVRQAADNVLALGPARALTGPAARGDHAVLQAQGAVMAARDPQLGQAYAALSALAGRLAHTGQALPAPPDPG